MNYTAKRILLPLATAICCMGGVALANNATEELFHLLDKDGCKSSSLAGRTWTISTSPVGTHGELLYGDVLEFTVIGAAVGAARKNPIQVTRNGEIWKSENGWSGQCTSDGTISQYVITGDVNIEGCLHELAIGRLDHDDNLANKIEVVFMDSAESKEGACESYTILHPGHAHGDEG